MKTDICDANVISSLSLEREVVRDLTPEEMNGANGGAVPQPDSPVIITIASAASPVSVVVTIAASVAWSLFHTKPAPM